MGKILSVHYYKGDFLRKNKCNSAVLNLFTDCIFFIILTFNSIQVVSLIQITVKFGIIKFIASL